MTALTTGEDIEPDPRITAMGVCPCRSRAISGRAMPITFQQFASDNYSGICQEAMEYLQRANSGHDCPYGDDQWTARAADKFRDLFETDCDVFFVFNGTAANSLAMATMCKSYHSIICAETGHIETDECGAPEFFSHGAKILLGAGADGKLSPDAIDTLVRKRSDIHYPKPKIISLTQATELGTVYTRNELLAIRERADRHNLRIHMDGARFANAVAALGMRPREITWGCGVDVLCFGGARFMCSWDTTEERIDQLIADLNMLRGE